MDVHSGIVFRDRRLGTRSGITLVEVLVVIGIAAILLAVTAAAVMSARSAAHRAECANKVRQVWLAIEDAADELGGRIPVVDVPSWTVSGTATGNLFHDHVLPRLGAVGLEHFSNSPGHSGHDRTIPALICPAESTQPWSRGLSSFCVSHGAGFVGSIPNGSTGLVDQWMPVSLRDIIDGRAQTAGVSERLVIPGEPSEIPSDQIMSDDKRYPWYTLEFSGIDVLAAAEQCQHHRTTQLPPGPGYGGIAYNHILGPNHPPCYNGPYSRDTARYIMTCYFILPPSSRHSGGVNVAFCDGHVQFVSNSVDLNLWRAWGTRNGNEPTSE